MTSPDDGTPKRRMLLGAIMLNSPSTGVHGLWCHAENRSAEYTSLDAWLELARLLERGRFDVLFLADAIGVYDTYEGRRDRAITDAISFPMNDPSLLLPAMAVVTKHLGFIWTGSVLQEPPFTFARRASTLDHLCAGRVGWNIVTTYVESAARSLGLPALPTHVERYALAHEYAEVCCKLWEGSWEEGAAVADRAARVYADPARIHPIEHKGRFFEVPGPHLAEPSPQRTPVLFQAGTSDDGRSFAAKWAECMFIGSPAPEKVIADVNRRAAEHGRLPGDIAFFRSIVPIPGGTEAEARSKATSYREGRNVEAVLAFLSGTMGIDLSAIDLDSPIGDFKSEAHQGSLLALAEAAPDRRWTWRELFEARQSGNHLVGTPEQIADAMERDFLRGIDGFLVSDALRPGTYADFVEAVIPELQRRGLVQREYAEGTLRQKLFGHPRLEGRHPAAAYRRQGGR